MKSYTPVSSDKKNWNRESTVYLFSFTEFKVTDIISNLLLYKIHEPLLRFILHSLQIKSLNM